MTTSIRPAKDRRRAFAAAAFSALPPRPGTAPGGLQRCAAEFQQNP